jgi:surface protein
MKNNNLSVLPWYDSLDKQDFKKSYAFGAVYPLYMLKGYINPFQIVNIDVDDFDDGYTIELVNFQTGVAVNVTTAMSPYISVAYVTAIFGNVIFMTDQPVVTSPKIGRYFLRITTALHQYFSDVITFVDSVSPFLKLEWWDVNDLQLEYGTLFYENYGFQNLLYLQTELGKPEYTFTDEGEERNGYFFPTKQISEKVFKFNFLSSEYLLDVMRLIRMSDYIRITDPFGRCYNANQFEIKSEWETQGNLASATVQFQTDAVVKKIALPVVVVQRDVINATLFHNIVLTSATEIWFAFYDQSPDLSGYSFAGYVDNNNRIECYKNGTKYILVNPQNNDMYAPISCYGFLLNYTALVVCNIENFNTQNVTNMQYMFRGCGSLTSLDLSSFNTQNVTNMRQMFDSCRFLTSLDVSNFNTQNVTNMRAMFSVCSRLTSLDVSGFNTANVTSMRSMFYDCSRLTSLDVSGFNTQNVTNMEYMFYYCNSLTSLDVSGFNTANVTSMRSMFNGCRMLQLIESNSFINNASLNSDSMFSSCTALVGGNGTPYSSAHTTAEYARVDGEDGLPGYFTAPQP